MTKMTFGNAQVVLLDKTVEGTVSIEDGLITEINATEQVPVDAVDFDGDVLMPGLVDLHSDHLEKHIMPRAGVYWHALSAAVSYDAQVISSGITTMLDSFGLVGEEFDSDRNAALSRMISGMKEAVDAGLLRADHYMHLRCEIIEPDIVERFSALQDNPLLKLVSLMDHTPGQRTFPDPAKWKAHQKRRTGASDDALDAIFAARQEARDRFAAPNRRAIAEICNRKGIAVASHDDTIPEEVLEAEELGNRISEFPTTRIAAAEARARNMKVVMGGPNIVRGGSHIGNFSAGECAKLGLLDILASDYIPASMLHAAFLLTDEEIGWSLPRAVATVTSTPAECVGLHDRGEIAVGKRADILRVRMHNGLPVVQSVWSAGRAVY
ncbi:alpha-D-ribose 1-methylphosphonate 5-triphosphate diphosphatase [Rhizobium sp. 1AS11]|uniref:alpha-D-ribose 1-methylphosphonate 5-triphosphate diphosphatase n=1 Tax=Rhizobium acaciae TaxID=2989736 RepID=UPI0022217293|nr:alpha-D-ribose 1-methylphosphonate 5-triphosphate diphosphatase [Rhizobium acaciae]MCW1412988.1 alpha-D-ribose 1-methylphosphonate 5-triphosphate diphosphatase [Rhizobium acaciae]MCW1745140.1 alpha-D-ribose 1-methylphosphonate 5-triphosphate diphosphatase [Rhizobium acaciae]